jgi:Sulfotransferase domain
MINKIISVAKFVTRRDSPGRLLKTWPDDVFLVSYPKSGNTWLRFLVANLIQTDPPVGLVGADLLIPAADGQSKKYFAEMARPRIIKSHYAFQETYKRVIYVVRDPRDVVMSQYHYQIKRGVLQAGAPVEVFVERFLKGEVCPYASWFENVSSWLATRSHDPEFLLLRYEDMQADILKQTLRITGFIGMEPDPDRLATAIERSSAKRMRELEKQEGNKWGSTKGTRQDMFFVRSATSGEGRATLPPMCLEQIEGAWGPLMSSLGYHLETGAATKPRETATVWAPS